MCWLLDDSTSESANDGIPVLIGKLRKCLSLAECIVSVRIRFLLLSIWGSHHIYDSKNLIENLYSHWLSASYHEVRHYLTRVADHEIGKKNEQGSYLPHGIISTNGETNHIQEGADNVGIYTETIDGKDTFYSMARAVFQVQSSSVGPIKRSLDRCLHITEASYDYCMSSFQEAKETCRTCPLC